MTKIAYRNKNTCVFSNDKMPPPSKLMCTSRYPLKVKKKQKQKTNLKTYKLDT